MPTPFDFIDTNPQQTPAASPYAAAAPVPVMGVPAVYGPGDPRYDAVMRGAPETVPAADPANPYGFLNPGSMQGAVAAPPRPNASTPVSKPGGVSFDARAATPLAQPNIPAPTESQGGEVANPYGFSAGMLSLLAQRGGGRGGPSNAQLQAAGAQATASRGAADAEAEKRAAAMDAAMRDAQAAGVVRGAQQAAQEQHYTDEMQRYAAEEEQQKTVWNQRVADTEKAMNEFREFATKEKPSRYLNGDVSAAIAMGIGAVFSPLFGGRNIALDIIKSKIAEDADIRARKLDAMRTVVDDRDKLIKRAAESLQDVDAAKAAYRAQMKDVAAMQAERYATLSGSAEKQTQGRDFAAALRQSAAEDRAQRDAAGYAALQKARASAGGADPLKRMKQVLELQKLGLSNAEIVQKLEAGPGGNDPKLREAARDFDKSEADLRAMRDMAIQLKNEGYTEIPGQERLLSSPGKLGERVVRKVTGIGGTSTGITNPTASRLSSSFKQNAASIGRAVTGAPQNSDTDIANSTEALMGNGTIDGLITNLNGLIDGIDGHREAYGLPRKHGAPQRAPAEPTPPVPGARRAGY